MEVINKQSKGVKSELEKYSIVTPDKVIHLGSQYQIKYAKGGGVGEGKTYKINNTTAIENEVNKFLHSLKLKDGYSNSMGTFTAKLTLEQFNKLVALIIGHDKNDNVYILDSSNNVVYDSKEARSKRKEMFKNYAKGGGVGSSFEYSIGGL